MLTELSILVCSLCSPIVHISSASYNKVYITIYDSFRGRKASQGWLSLKINKSLVDKLFVINGYDLGTRLVKKKLN